MRYYAHTADDEDGNRLPEEHWQPLSDHLRTVAVLARQFGAPLGMGLNVEVAGALHDLGKYRDEFQEYLRQERPSSKETQHAIFGAALAFNSNALGAAFAIAGHHAGLHNLSDLQQKVRSNKPDPLRVSRELGEKLRREYGPVPDFPNPPSWIRTEFSAEFYTRMVLSCVVDADRLNTANWKTNSACERELESDRLLRLLVQELNRKKSASMPSTLRSLRNRIFDSCLNAGTLPQGFFSLTVPTGGGKTLSSMAFALAHSKQHALRRVIVVIPYLSIIEQNAAEYSRIFGREDVLELHSAVQPQLDSSEEERSQLDLISENWNAPIIVTTSVQFLESLFAASPSRCRKLHRIAHSVVIFDEVQTLPAHLLSPVFSTIRELQANYGVSFVFCTATQPAFRRSAMLPEEFFSPEEVSELAPDPPGLFRELRRVAYHLPVPGETQSWDSIADQMARNKQVLCIVNLTRHAAELWDRLRLRLPNEERPIHLSAGMCAQHRLDLINRIRALLREGRPCRVVSTQLIEAGVDVDFPVVWRAMGPLDSIVQAAGRCNREGLLAQGHLYVFSPEDHTLPPGVYRSASSQAIITLASLGTREAAARRLATEPDIFRSYFQALYEVVNLDYRKGRETSIQEDRACLRFRDVARKAKVIEDAGHPVIVPYSDAASLIEEIRNRPKSTDGPRFRREDMRRLQRFVVNVRNRDFSALLAREHLRQLLPGMEFYCLDEGLYHRDVGLIMNSRPLEDFLQ